MPLFDRIVMVDWSAAAVPTTGRDSIWVSDGGPAPINMATRSEAMAWLCEVARQVLRAGQRMLIGFDFAFGYPQGVAVRFGRGWRSLWSWVASQVTDGDRNENNRFAVAEAFNRRFPDAQGPLWGHPPGRRYADLSAGKPHRRPDGIAERRHVERLVPSASPVWKLAYAGAVGSQSILGIARLEHWRRDPEFADAITVWPFETAFDQMDRRPIVLAEIYPSLFQIQAHDGEVKDAAQVRTLASGFAALDRVDRLRPHLSGPGAGKARDAALVEEGWIMGVSDRPLALA